MDTKKQLKEAIEWTKQAGHWLNKNQPKLASATEPIMAKASLDLGYLMSVDEFVRATQAPPLIQTVMYAAAIAGKHKFNEIVGSEINRGLKEYNSRQTSGNTFNWARNLGLLGVTSLALATASTYFDSDSRGTPISGEQKVAYVTPDLLQRPANDTLRMIIEEPIDDIIDRLDEEENFEFPEDNLILVSNDLEDNQGLNYDNLEKHFLSLRENNPPKMSLEDITTLRLRLEENLERISLLERELHPRAQDHYNAISKGHDRKSTIRKFELAKQYDHLIKKYAEEENIPYTMMFALIINESAGEKRARSHAGARGLMQIMPRTAEWFQKDVLHERFSNSALYDPKKNIRLGAKYLAFLHKRVEKKLAENEVYNLDKEEVWDITMACYNRGYGGLTRVLFNEDRVERVLEEQKEGKTDVPVYSFWSLKKGETTDEAFRYVSKIRGLEELYAEELQQQAGMSNEVARLVH
jgi:hypothetical protein